MKRRFVILLALLSLALPGAAAAKCRDIEKELDGLIALKADYNRRDRALKKLLDQGKDARPAEVRLEHSAHHEWHAAKKNSKTPLPANAEDPELIARAIATTDSRGRVTFWAWSTDCGCWYRYQGAEQGGVLKLHWNGMTAPTNPAFRFPGPAGPVHPGKLPWKPKRAFLTKDELPDLVRNTDEARAERGLARGRYERTRLELFEE